MRGRLTGTHYCGNALCSSGAESAGAASARAGGEGGVGGGGGAGVAPVEATLGAERREGEELRVGQQVEERAAAQQADALAIAQ